MYKRQQIDELTEFFRKQTEKLREERKATLEQDIVNPCVEDKYYYI